jgi:hypothetical protein
MGAGDTLERSDPPPPEEIVMAQYTESVAATPRIGGESLLPIAPRTLWRVAGGLALAHVVLLFAAFSQEVSVEHGQSPLSVLHVYGAANLTRVFAGGYVEAASFLVLTAAAVVVARVFGRRTETGRLAAGTFLALAVALVGSTLAVGFPAGAAALYGAQHGATATEVATVNDIRNFGFVLEVALQAGMALALGIAALAERVLVKWAGWAGMVVGIAGIVLVPFAHDLVSMVLTIWWVGLAVLLLRARPATAGGQAS